MKQIYSKNKTLFISPYDYLTHSYEYAVESMPIGIELL